MPDQKIAVVVPTVPGSRDAQYQMFLDGWRDQFAQHNVELITVFDGDAPTLKHRDTTLDVPAIMQVGDADYSDLIFNRNDGVRNLGFAYIARFLPETQIIVTLDDDVLPLGDTLGDHLTTLQKRVPLSWMSTASEYMRGFPWYGVRDEAPVAVSHGVWQGVHDYDAPTQLVRGNPPATFPNSPIPRGIYAPICGMNLAFRREVLQHLYFAPMGPKVNMDRFADIWMGIYLKRAMDESNQAIYTGGAQVLHERASNIWANLKKEGSDGLRLNETLWQGDESNAYFHWTSPGLVERKIRETAKGEKHGNQTQTVHERVHVNCQERVDSWVLEVHF